MKPTALFLSMVTVLAPLMAWAAVDLTPSPLPNRLRPEYPCAFAPASEDEIKAVLRRVRTFLEARTPVRVVDRQSGAEVDWRGEIAAEIVVPRVGFYLTSYEWGVTYSGMLAAAAATGEVRYRGYVDERLTAIARLAAVQVRHPVPAAESRGRRAEALRNVVAPASLDDAGAMCAAMLRARRAGLGAGALDRWIGHYLGWIRSGQTRLADGTLSRQEPLPDSLWLDDLYMSVPALALHGAEAGDPAATDDAARQVLQFAHRMFRRQSGLFVHGWVQGLEPGPAFHWGRANGWAALAMADLLSEMPQGHPARAEVLELFRAHARGLLTVQDGAGLWHQLLDRPSSYVETSASAMFVFALARGVNRGWLDGRAYGPAIVVGWNAVAARVTAAGEVEGTCIGTAFGFEAMYYHHRPASALAAHGYGPVLLAGAEMIEFGRGAGRGLGLDGALVPAASSAP